MREEHKIKSKEEFALWLNQMEASLSKLKLSFNNETEREKLDFSIESLSFIEAWLLQHFASYNEILSDDNLDLLDGLGRYIGETLRQNLGGRWSINLLYGDNVFYQLPTLTWASERFEAPGAYECPLSLVTTCLHRRTGKFMETISNSLERTRPQKYKNQK